MELDISLITCPQCNIVFQYYDFLSHNTHTCNRNSYVNNRDNNISDMETEIDEDENIDENIQNIMTLDNRITGLNGLNDYGNYRNLHNPMINRNFNNHNNNHNNNLDIDTNTFINNFESMNIINENEKLKYNIKKDLDLEKYNKKVQCNERTDCTICLVSYPEHTTFYLMSCNHSFCIDCCEKWYSTNSLCPLCRNHYTKLNIF